MLMVKNDEAIRIGCLSKGGVLQKLIIKTKNGSINLSMQPTMITYYDKTDDWEI